MAVGLVRLHHQADGDWLLGGVVDYRARVNVACTVGITKTTNDAIVMFETALAEVEVLLGVDWVTISPTR